MEVNLLAVIVATIAQFIIGGIWYTPLFGNIWGKIHGFDTLSKTTQDDMKKQIAPLLVAQLVASFITAYVLAHFIKALPEVTVWQLVLWIWLGFVVMTQVGAVLFGGTKSKWMVPKIAIMAGGSLACLLAAGYIIHWIV